MVTPSSSMALTDRDLRTRRPWVRWAVAGATLAAIVLVVAAHRDAPLRAGLLAAVVVVHGRLVVVDLAEQRLPNRITLPLAGATAAVLLVAGIGRSDVGAAIAALGVGLAFAVVLSLARLGMGDVKLALSVGAVAGWLGREAVMATMLVGSSAGAATAVVLMAVHRRRDLSFGFGPFLALGSVAGMLAGA